MKVNSRVSGEDQTLVGNTAIYPLREFDVEEWLNGDLVAVRNEVLRQSHVRWRSRGGRHPGRMGRHVQVRGLNFEQNGHGDNAGNGRDCQDDKGDGDSLGCKGLLGHGGCFLWSVLYISRC